MNNPNAKEWTKQEITLLSSLVDEHYTYYDISAIFEDESKLNKEINMRSASSIRHKVNRMNKNSAKKTLATPSTKILKEDAALKEFKAEKQVFEEITQRYKPRQCTNYTTGILKKQKLSKYIVMSDLHFPIVESDLLYSIVDEHSDADGIILNGDILDCYIYSSFAKNKSLAAIDEYRSAFDFIKKIQPFFKNIWLTEGNHDARVFRYLSSKLILSDASSLFQPNLLARMANGEELDAHGNLVAKFNWKNVHFDRNQSWYVRIGNAICCHPSFNISSAPGMGVRKAASKINMIYPQGDIDCIIMGHSHAVYKGVVNDQLLIEEGCLTTFHGYSFAARSSYPTAPQMGYATLYQDKDGNTDFNKTNFIYCGRNLPNPKPARS